MPSGTFPSKEPARQSPRGTRRRQVPAVVLHPQVPPQAPRGLRCSAAAHNPDSSLVPRPPEPPRRPVKALAVHEELFRPALDGARDKANFVRAVQNFTEYNVHKRGHVDFIYLALRKMRHLQLLCVPSVPTERLYSGLIPLCLPGRNTELATAPPNLGVREQPPSTPVLAS